METGGLGSLSKRDEYRLGSQSRRDECRQTDGLNFLTEARAEWMQTGFSKRAECRPTDILSSLTEGRNDYRQTRGLNSLTGLSLQYNVCQKLGI